MARKVIRVIALMFGPKFAILDKPTSGLDVINIREVRALVKEFAKRGTTVLPLSHNMFEVDFSAAGSLSSMTAESWGTPPPQN